MDEIICADSYEYLKKIESNSVDLVIIDPPYLFHESSGGSMGNRKYKDQIRTLNQGIDMKIFDELDRVMKRTNIYIWCNKSMIRDLLNRYSDCLFEILTWHKTNPIPKTNNCYLPDTEFCLFFKEKGVFLGGDYNTKHHYWITKCNTEDKKMYGHPTIKPLPIIENLIYNSSNPGDVVLDCFAGSGTTCVAAKKLGRRYIGIEIDKNYCDIANKRLENIEPEQISLFDE